MNTAGRTDRSRGSSGQRLSPLPQDGMILLGGLRENNARFVNGCILQPGYPAVLLFPAGR